MQHSVDFEALSALERAAGPVWTMMDNFTALFAEYEKSDDDVATRLEAMQKSYASSLQLLHRLQIFEKTMHDRIEQFTRTTERSEMYISRTSLVYGINLLPDEVLSMIFVLAATELEEKVALSLVCKRFRRVMMSMRKMWDGYMLESSQSLEQIIAIAERHGFASLKASIYDSADLPFAVKDRIDGYEVDFAEYSLRYYKFCVGLIMSFNPEHLEFVDLLERDWEEIEPILGGANVQKLHSLVMVDDSRNPTTMRLLERWRIPQLQNLEVSFVPGAGLAGSLVQCGLFGIEEAEFYSLRKFFAAAKSLQELQLFLSKETRRFCEVCDLPSLRSLVVNFVPRPPLVRHLIRFRLSGFSTYHSHSLSEMLDFLSSLEACQELTIDYSFEYSDTIDASPTVNMPSLVSGDFQMIIPILVAKLRMPSLRTLKLRLHNLDELSPITRNEFRFSLQSMSSLEELELYGRGDVAILYEIIRYAPSHLESFSLKGCECSAIAGEYRSTSPAPPRKLVDFRECWVYSDFIPAFVGYLQAVGLSGMQIQFNNSRKWTKTDDVVSVFEL